MCLNRTVSFTPFGRLTVSVWALVIVLAACAGLYAAGSFFPTARPSGTDASSRSQTTEMPDEAKAFFDAPLEHKIRESTVIALARYQRDGNKLRCPISEILKQAPGIEFRFKVGDEIDWCNFMGDPDTTHGDGQIIFFQGNPARARFGTTFSGDRLFDDDGVIPIEKIREMIKTQAG